MKTAKIEVGHVFGTMHTNYAEVTYRGKRKFFVMENESRQALSDAAVGWAKNHGFTHFVINLHS